jgi:hypothetical protein
MGKSECNVNYVDSKTLGLRNRKSRLITLPCHHPFKLLSQLTNILNLSMILCHKRRSPMPHVSNLLQMYCGHNRCIILRWGWHHCHLRQQAGSWIYSNRSSRVVLSMRVRVCMHVCVCVCVSVCMWRGIEYITWFFKYFHLAFNLRMIDIGVRHMKSGFRIDYKHT